MAHEVQSESARRNRRFISAAMQAPLLSATHEHELATRWRDDGDETALHELVGAYLRLVIAIAGKFRRHGLPLAELVQEGSIGLMQVELPTAERQPPFQLPVESCKLGVEDAPRIGYRD